MSHNVVASIDCDKSGFPCGSHAKVRGEHVSEVRARLKAQGWAVNVTVTLSGGRKTKHDYCPEHKGSL